MDIGTAKQMLDASWVANDAVIIEGVHGIGKSAITKQFASGEIDGREVYLVELFLSHQEVGDLIGSPHTYIDEEGNAIQTWSVPIWLQRMRKAAKEGKFCVLFLDELNRAPLDVRQSAMQLVLEGRIHEHDLPISHGHKTMVVAAMNPSDEYQVDELDPALLDRFLYLFVEPDAPAFLKYAAKKNLNRAVRDFIAENPKFLHFTPTGDTTADCIGSTPRSWEKLCGYLDNADKIPDNILLNSIRGKLGKAVGSKFYTYFKNYVDVVKMETIEKLVQDNKDSVATIEELSDMIAELMSKAEAIQKTEMIEQMERKYMQGNKKDILPFLAYLYSLEIEIITGFLKSYREDNVKLFQKLADIDEKINNKMLFKRILTKSKKR